MTITPEQRRYARLAGIMFLLNYVLQGSGDSVTIMSHGSASFAECAHWAAESALPYRVSLLQVGASWIAIAILAASLARPKSSTLTRPSRVSINVCGLEVTVDDTLLVR